MSETFFVADTHFDHPNIIIHCKRQWLMDGDLNANGKWVNEAVRAARTAEMNVGVAASWNGVVGKDDTVYIVGDFAWKNHRKWVNELNGKKVFLVGSHDKMPQDCLDLFKPDIVLDDGEVLRLADVVKTMVQFREVHWQLYRQICGQWMHLDHWPKRTWQGKPRDSWCLTGHTHGRMKVCQPGEIGGGLILDVGWDVWKRPISFGEVRAEMKRKYDMGATRYDAPTEVDRD